MRQIDAERVQGKSCGDDQGGNPDDGAIHLDRPVVPLDAARENALKYPGNPESRDQDEYRAEYAQAHCLDAFHIEEP